MVFFHQLNMVTRTPNSPRRPMIGPKRFSCKYMTKPLNMIPADTAPISGHGSGSTRW
jgi:hypothetical protein